MGTEVLVKEWYRTERCLVGKGGTIQGGDWRRDNRKEQRTQAPGAVTGIA